MPAALEVSSIFYLGIGERVLTTYGGDLRGIAGVGGPETMVRQRLQPDGTIVARNGFTQPARKRFDLRLQQRIPLGNRVALDGIAELFNLFNSPNFTVETQESNLQFGRPTLGEYRRAQLGFRLAF